MLLADQLRNSYQIVRQRIIQRLYQLLTQRRAITTAPTTTNEQLKFHPLISFGSLDEPVSNVQYPTRRPLGDPLAP